MPEPTHKVFSDVLRGEREVVNKRRELVAEGRLCHDRVDADTQLAKDLAKDLGKKWVPSKVRWEEIRVDDRQPDEEKPSDLVKHSDINDEREHTIPRLHSEQEIVGLACSGGGVRSSAFCLGVFQGLDSINPNEKPQVLEAVDYLSTVSGGGYIGASVAAGLMQTKGRFPFESKLDDQETLEMKHLRDNSNYLAQGFFDILVGLTAVLRGLVSNAMIFLGIILALAALTVWLFPNETATALRKPAYFGWTTVAFFAILIFSQFIYVLAGRKRSRKTLTQRQKTGERFTSVLLLLAIVTFIELQPYVLAALFDARHLSLEVPNYQENLLGRALSRLNIEHAQVTWTSLGAAAIALLPFVNKLIAVATATRGDQTNVGILKHWASRVALYAAAIVVPLFLWFTYLAFSYWGIGWENYREIGWENYRGIGWQNTHSYWGIYVPSQEPAWLTCLSDPSCLASQAFRWQICLIHLLPSRVHAWLFWLVGLAIWEKYAIAAVVFIVLSLCITPNANSLHGYYRDRLSRAFLWNCREPENAAVQDGSASENDPDQFKLTRLAPKDGEKKDNVPYAPYLLINTAVNLQGSDYLNKRGRNADSFFFSPLYVGSVATGYSPTSDLENIDPHLNLATAMAISGAAASPNMGASTIRALTFSLAALNVRLGYWFPNPGSKGVRGSLPWIWPIYFTLELFGRLDEQTKNVYLTDGGHFDNLGIYELLRRRCKVIIAADAEADPPLNCESLIRLQKYARIDLGVRIDLPWEDIRRSTTKITEESPHGPTDDPALCWGPHVAIGRIDYGKDKNGKDEYGVLIYIKASLSGDESDLIRDYRRRYPNFPHETTLDQFFGEEQFEVYRDLGFHATHNFFTGRDRAAMLKASPVKDWPEVIRKALIRLNIPARVVGRIVEHQRAALPREYGVPKV